MTTNAEGDRFMTTTPIESMDDLPDTPLQDIKAARGRFNSKNVIPLMEAFYPAEQIQVMRDKGLVTCDETSRPQLYAAAASKEQTQLNLLEDLAQRVFEGSTKKLVMSLLSADRVTMDEVREMQQIVHKAKGEKP